MRWALLLYAEVDAASRSTPPQAAAELQRYGEVTDEMARAGVLRGGEAFRPAAEAVHIGGDAPPTVGAVHADPELSGFYVIECDTAEEAIGWARRLPVASHGRVEVRPLMELPPPSTPELSDP